MRNLRHRIIIMLLGWAAIASLVSAKVVRVEIKSREPATNGQLFGRSGCYEKITGKIYAEICSTSTRKTFSMPFYWGGSVAYPVVSMDNSHATLTVRPYRGDEPTKLPRDQWAFAHWDK